MMRSAKCVGVLAMVMVLSEMKVVAVGTTKPPNIIFVVADDVGWNDVGWNNPDLVTPNLNRYARQGVILNSSYVQYFCSPSRNCFMTGYYPYHTGLQNGVIMPGDRRYVPSNFTMLPQLLKQAGYQTHLVGKWHLGMCNWEYTPTYRGFDTFFGYYNAYEDYYTHAANGGYDFRDQTTVYREPNKTYFNYLLTDHTEQLVDNLDTTSPLFLYLPFHLCHGPLQVPQKYQDMYSSVQNRSRRIYSGMVTLMDESFGVITQALDRRGLLDNALLIFTTDNGGSVQYGGNNWPLRGGKGTFWEGGTRGVAFVWSKNLLSRTGYVNNEMMHAVDWFPTILHLAGLQPDSPIDGVNQWDMLSQNGSSGREEFVYNIDTVWHSTAIRYKDYKLITGRPGWLNDWYPVPQAKSEDHLIGRNVRSQKRQEWKPQLYNIKNDPEERHDLAESEPQTLQMMQGRLDEWMKSNVPPQRGGWDPQGDPKNWGGVWTPGWC